MATPTLHIHPRVLRTSDTLRYEFDLVYSDSARTETVFYELARDAVAETDTFDGILCATILHAMGERRDVHLHGPATEAIVRNLAEFQAAWQRWRPADYQPVEIHVETIAAARLRPMRSLAAFSGGVDSTFTLFRNAPAAPTPRYAVDTLLLVHGFDVDLPNTEALAELIERTAPVRALAGSHLFTVRTNSKVLKLQRWEDSCGAQLAACLHLFSPAFSHALIGGSDAYDELWLPWGTNPVTDHLLSGGHLSIVHDGAAFSRTDKIEYLAKVPAALQSLKVCWQGKEQGRNCGVCEKCVRTQINLLAVGVPAAPCFDRVLDPDSIRTLEIRDDLVLAELRSIIEYGERHHLDQPWFRALVRRVRKGKGRPRRRSLRARVQRSLAGTRLISAARTVRSKLGLLAWS